MKNNIGINCSISPSSIIGKNVSIGNNVTIYDNVTIEDNVYIWDNCVIGRIPMTVRANNRDVNNFIKTTRVGENSVIGCNVVIYSGGTIMKNCIIGDNSVIRENVFFEDDVIIGFNSSIQYNVRIGNGSRILQQSAVSSFTEIGKMNFISCGFICVSDRYFGKEGYSEEKIFGPKIGDNNNIGPNVTVISNIVIGSGNTIGAHSLITKDIKNNALYYGSPAKLIRAK